MRVCVCVFLCVRGECGRPCCSAVNACVVHGVLVCNSMLCGVLQSCAVCVERSHVSSAAVPDPHAVNRVAQATD